MKKQLPAKLILKTTLLLGLLLLPLVSGAQTNAWINEFHYDDAGGDSNEGVEVIIESPGTLSSYEVVLYNGSNGASYSTNPLDGFTEGETVGDFTVYHKLISGIQNGAPDGLALVYNGDVLQFLSYEGSFAATDGSANGITSTEISESENGTPENYSLQLSGSGSAYSDFSWQAAALNTFGTLNTGQTLAAPANTAPAITAITTTPATPTATDAVTVSATITDDDAVASATLYWNTTSGDLVATGTAITMSASGDTYTTATAIPAQANGTTVYYQIVAIDNDAATPLTTTSAEQSYTVSNTNALPVITAIATTPVTPTNDDTVTVSATVTDDGSLTAVTLNWGTVSGSLGNAVTMTASGDTYSGDIPAQANGTTVYYEIVATDDDTEVTTSAEQSYTLTNAAPIIADIAASPASPTPTDTVEISATVTDSDDALASVTLNWGTVSGSLSNALAMSASGDTYSATIPAQADGTTVYYEIVAADDDVAPETTTSAEQSYTVAEPVAINAWINEFHYDNDGSDTDEGVEIVVESVDDIANYSIVLYNGSNGTSYTGAGALTLTHTEGDFTIYTADASGMQNGAPDGVALVYNGTAIQFLSYEGSFTATNGPANGMTSTDVGVAEVSTTTVGYSLQLSGTGTTYTDFTWEEAAASTFGAVNTGQTFGEHVNTTPEITAIATSPVAPKDTDAVSISATITDDDAVASATLYWDTTSGDLVATGTAITMTASGDTYTTDANIPVQAPGTTVYYQIVAIDNDPTSPLTTTSAEASYLIAHLAAPGDIIITELMQNPAAVADPEGEYFEVYNTTTAVINLNGWDINDADGLDHTIETDVFVPAGGFAVLGRNADTATNDGVTVDYVFPSDVNLSNSSDTLILLNTADTEIDRIDYDGGTLWPDPDGAAMVYIGLVTEDNNDSSLWVAAHASEGITLDAGSPGSSGIEQTMDKTVYVYTDDTAGWDTTPGATAEYLIMMAGTTTLTATNVSTIQVRAGATMNIATDLDMTGALINLGSLDMTNAALTLSGTVTQGITGNGFSVNVFVLDNLAGADLDLTTAMDVYDGVNLVNGELYAGYDLTFKSTAEKTAILRVSSGTISGVVTAEHHYDAIRAYRFISSPVNSFGSINDNWQENATSSIDNFVPGYGTHITGSTTAVNGLDETERGNPSMFTFENSTYSWEPVLDTETPTLDIGDAYRLMVRGDRSIDLTAVEDPAATETVLRTTGTPTVADVTLSYPDVAGADEAVLVGNPYLAPVNMVDVLAASTGFDPSYFYYWDPSISKISGGESTNGAWVTVLIAGGVGNNNEDSTGDENLPVGTAAIFASTAADPTMNFTAADMVDVTTATSPARMVDNEMKEIRLGLYVASSYATGGTNQDALWIRMKNDYSNAIDSYDAPKFFNSDENIATLTDNQILSVESRSLPVDGEHISIYTTNYRSEDYVFKAKLTGFADNEVFLYDSYTNELYALMGNGETAIPFKVEFTDVSDQTDRFEFRFTTENLGTDSIAVNEFKVFPNPVQDGRLNIKVPQTQNELQIKMHNILGQEVLSTVKTTTKNVVSLDVTSLVSGVYILQINDGERTHTQRVIIK